MAGRPDIVLIDTNVLLSAVLFGGKPGELLDLVRTGRLAAATSLYILREFQQVLTRPRFGFAADAAAELAVEMAAWMQVTVTQARPRQWVADPKDDPVVEAALATGASIIVTGDRLLLQAKIPGVEVLTVSAMLQRFERAP